MDDDDGAPLHAVAYSVGGYHGPILPRERAREDTLGGRRSRSSASTRRRSSAAYRALPEIEHGDEYDWQAREREQQRERACFALDEDDADAARAFGCLLELAAPEGRRASAYVTDPAWLADRLAQKIAAYVAAEEERKTSSDATHARPPPQTTPSARLAASSGERDYEERVAARARNLDLGAALARWEPKLDTDAVKLLGSLVLIEHGRSAAWAYRLCVEQPTTENKQGKVTVRYPRGAQAEKEHHAQALAALKRARTPEAALAVVLRLLVAQRLADTSGLPGADRQGVYEPQVLAGSKVLGKLARRVAPPSVKRHLAEQEAERERREQERRAEQEARLSEQRAKLAAGEPIRCECCFGEIESPEQAAEKHGALVHAGECEQQWGSADDGEEDG